MRRRAGIVPLTSFLAATACAGPSGPAVPATADLIVVHGVLTAAARTQALWIERSRSADSVLTTAPRPLEPPPARIEVRDGLGAVHVFSPDPANPTRFTADLAPVPGRRYDLVIEAGARRVTGTVVVPATVALIEPAGDTAVVAAAESLGVRWTGAPGGRFAWTASPLDSASWGLAAARGYTRDTVVALPGFVFGSSSVLWVMSLDAATWAYFSSPLGPEHRVLTGNLVGGVGVFGAMTADRVVVRAGG